MTGSGGLLVHAAGLLLCAAIIMPSMRRLRWLSLAAGVVALAYVALSGEGRSLAPWIALFVLANAVRLVALHRGSVTATMRAEEKTLFEHMMLTEEPTQQRRLLDLLRWKDVASGEVLMSEGDGEPPLIFVSSGTANIVHEDKVVGTSGPGDFLGEMSLVSGGTASATVTAADPMRIAQFDRDALAQLGREVPEIRRAIDGALNRSLATKVMRMNRAISGDGEE